MLNLTRTIACGFILAVSLTPASTYARKLPRHAPGASSAATSPGFNNDGGGYRFKNGRIVRVPPMQPVRPGGQIQMR
jgi:hypothetical protein